MRLALALDAEDHRQGEGQAFVGDDGRRHRHRVGAPHHRQRRLVERCIARALGSLGVLALAQGDDARAATLYEESLTLGRKAGDQHLIAGVLDGLGVAALNQGNEARAVMFVEESLALYRDLGDTRGIADALRSLGWLALNQGDLARAEALLEESLALYRKQG